MDDRRIRYSIMPPEVAEEAEFLPEVLQNVFRERRGQFILALMGEEPAGYAVLSWTEQIGARLDYIYVFEKYRDQGVSSGLIEYACAELGQSGISVLHAIASGDMEQIASYYTFFLANHFDVVSAFEHWMEYHLKYMMEKEPFGSIARKGSADIRKQEDIPERVFRSMVSELQTEGITLEQIGYDAGLSRFCMKNGKVSALMLIRKDDGGRFEMPLVYAMPRNTNPADIPNLILECTGAAFESAGEDAVLRLYIQRNNLYLAIRKYFGEPENEQIIQKYERNL
ncbi:MAG: GNAT family N-acetyltransferase [Butyrivibrio sp.]|jgi:GNAT superfamily N-acetyltransferase|nr:GNAT family N-acetyltransferase [Butyrivibrio sp.]